MATPKEASTAVLYTGFLRGKEKTKKSFGEFLIHPYNAKIFVATWDVPDITRPPLGGDEEVRVPGKVRDEEIVEFFGDQIADYSISSFDLFKNSTPLIKPIERSFDLLTINHRARVHNTVWMNRLFAQWYLVRKGLKMIEEYQIRTRMNFDIICRTRTDIELLEIPPAPVAGKLCVPAVYPRNVVEHDPTVPSSMLTDYFYWGEVDVMFKMADLCYNIETMYERQYVDCTNAEHLLYSYTLLRDIAVHTFPLNYLRIL